jgi:hypothetical protein
VEGSTQQLVFRKTPEHTDRRSTGDHQTGLVVICLSGGAAVKVDGKELSLIRTCPCPVIVFAFYGAMAAYSEGDDRSSAYATSSEDSIRELRGLEAGRKK